MPFELCGQKFLTVDEALGLYSKEELLEMANPNLEAMNEVTLKVFQKSLSDDLFIKSSMPFLSYLKQGGFETLYFLNESNFNLIPQKEIPKKKGRPKQIEIALQELEGMGYVISTNVSQLLYTDEWEVRVAALSDAFGKIIKLERIDGDNYIIDTLNKVRDKAIIWIWKKAKAKLIAGEFI